MQFLAEIGFRRTLDTAAALTQINTVQVFLNDRLFVVVLFHQRGAEKFLHLTLHSNTVVLCDVFDQLLGNTGAAHCGFAKEHIGKRLDGREPVNALMLIEALVLDSDRCIDQGFGDLLIVRLLPVGAGVQFLQHLDLPVVVDTVNR